jgi:hypothetical protein
MVNSRLYRLFKVVSVFAFLFSFSACLLYNQSKDKVVITVGSRHITKTELEKEIKNIADEMGIPDEDLK